MSNLDNHQQPKEKKKDSKYIRTSFGCFLLLVLSSTYIFYFSTSKQTRHVRRLQLEEQEQEQDRRPIMYAFFEPINDSRKVSLGLRNWKNAWSEAGWRPVVLTLEDAKRHKSYQKFNDAFESAEYKIDKHSQMSFYRWLAMAAAGGGWMSDLDTFPLFSNPKTDGLTLPNQGKFTCHSRHVPNLVSGTGSEFERMTNILYYSYSMHKNEFWNDMYAMLEAHLFLNNYYDADDSVSLEHFYAEELQQGGMDAIKHPYAIGSKCEHAAGKRVVHFSQAACHTVGFCHRKREIAVPLWIRAFREKCLPYM